MSTISLLSSQDQALALLQSTSVKPFQDGISKEDEPKTAIEKIQHLVTVQPAQEGITAKAQARVTDAELQAKEEARLQEAQAQEAKAASDAGIPSGVDPELYNMIAGLSEEARLELYNETREKAQVYVKQYLTADVQASRDPLEKVLAIGSGVDKEAKDRDDTSRVILEKFWAVGIAQGFDDQHLLSEKENFDQISNRAKAIEAYYVAEYGQGSVEHITLSSKVIDARDDILALRDDVVEKYGHESTQYMQFMTDLLRTTGKGVFFKQDIEGLGTLDFAGNNRITLTQKDGVKEHIYQYSVTDGELTKTHINTIDNSEQKTLTYAEIAYTQSELEDAYEKLKQIDFSKGKNFKDLSFEINASQGRWFDWVYE